MHTHKNGRNVKLSHIRNGTELSRIVEDNNYNYNYQEVRQLANETKVLPGDFMILECAYNTKELKKPTLGGYSLNEGLKIIKKINYKNNFIIAHRNLLIICNVLSHN